MSKKKLSLCCGSLDIGWKEGATGLPPVLPGVCINANHWYWCILAIMLYEIMRSIRSPWFTHSFFLCCSYFSSPATTSSFSVFVHCAHALSVSISSLIDFLKKSITAVIYFYEKTCLYSAHRTTLGSTIHLYHLYYNLNLDLFSQEKGMSRHKQCGKT